MTPEARERGQGYAMKWTEMFSPHLQGTSQAFSPLGLPTGKGDRHPSPRYMDGAPEAHRVRRAPPKVTCQLLALLCHVTATLVTSGSTGLLPYRAGDEKPEAKAWQACVPSGGRVALPCPGSRGPFLHLQVPPSSSSSSKGPCDGTEPTQLIQDHVPPADP